MKKSNNKRKEAFFSAGAGSALGAGVHRCIGGAGIVIMGGGFAIGLGGFMAIGAVLGLAAYGVKSAMESEQTV